MDTIRGNVGVRSKKGWMQFAVFAVVFGMTCAMAAKEARLTVSSDMVTHMQYILSLDRVLSLSHWGWHFICWLCYACLPVTPVQAVSVVTALFNGLTAVLVAELAYRYLNGTAALRPEGGTRAPAWLPAAIAFVACTAGPLYLRFYNANYYKGQGTPNVWHNPTAIAVRPFLILTDWLALEYLECRKQEKAEGGNARAELKKKLRKQQYLLAAVLAVGTLIKPSILMVYLPVCAVAELVNLIRNRGGWKRIGDAILKNLYFLPALLIFLWQYLSIYIVGGTAAGEGGIVIAPFRTARMYAPSVLVSLCLKMAFPILVIWIWRKKIFKDRLFVLAFGQFLTGLLITWTFAETGRRAAHGNFGWANMLAASFLWIFCIVFYFRELLQDWKKLVTEKACRWKYAVPMAVLIWHFLAGLCYYWELLNDMGRQL